MKQDKNEQVILDIIGETQKILKNVTDVLEKSSHDPKGVDVKQEIDATKIEIVTSALEFLSCETDTAATKLEEFLKNISHIDKLREKWGL